MNFSNYFRKFSYCSKIDRFAGSEPRLFTSFHLDNESIGQPTPVSVKAMDSTPIDPDKPARTDLPTEDCIEVIEISLWSPERVDSAPNSLPKTLSSPRQKNQHLCCCPKCKDGVDSSLAVVNQTRVSGQSSPKT